MRRYRRGAAALALMFGLTLFAASLPAQEQAPAGKAQTVCPVMGGQINKDVFVDYQGQRVYFCCPACIEVFKKDPEKYLQQMKAAGVAPEKLPAKK
jgi:YHS domain-containing protein